MSLVKYGLTSRVVGPDEVAQFAVATIVLAVLVSLIPMYAYGQTHPVPIAEYSNVDVAGNHFRLVIDSLTSSGFATGTITLERTCGDVLIWADVWDAQRTILRVGKVPSGGPVGWSGTPRDQQGKPLNAFIWPYWWFSCGGDWSTFPHD